ncbi:MAG: rod shape-determining protein [Planctomycetia bacterium]|nr:rod shape-determining protein [Planctomycetia bacterium]
MLERLFGVLGSDLAIDLGTANTLIGVAGEGLVLNEPSVVAVEQGTTRIVSGGRAVGHLARQMSGRTPGSISVVRPLSAGVITDFELCETMLRYFFAKAQRGAWSRGPRVLVAVPGAITPVEKRAVYNSAHRAGARRVFLASACMAAAVGAELPITEPVANMICDIGGGTTEVAVLSLGDVVAGTTIRMGGDRMDQAIVDHLRRRHELKIGPATAEQLRIDVGSATPPAEELVAEVRGIDTMTGLPRRATVTSAEVRDALLGPLDEITEAIKATIDDCPPELAADLVDTGLVLSGGAALLRGLDAMIEERIGVPARMAPDCMTTVASGTLALLEHLQEWQQMLESSDDDV